MGRTDRQGRQTSRQVEKQIDCYEDRQFGRKEDRLESKRKRDRQTVR